MRNKIVDGIAHFSGMHGFDYSEIDENVFIGTNMCCEFGFKKELLDQGVRADISLEEDKTDAPRGVEYFLWLPTKDGHAPALDQLKLGVQTLDFLISRRIKVYIHCKNGHGRAPSLYAAYLISKGMTLERAVATVKEKRPEIHINQRQTDTLEKFQSSAR